ncbi:hypothetical protein OIU79_006654 [Salix purpurea]|uniref:Uncharacterized protein n=1 Tax=Salix purpurea TaxID=77065 RepID=A0A9Q0TW25_SALPP|nr:hypothetical protein OIU79_006654 [Salix purpurea]
MTRRKESPISLHHLYKFHQVFNILQLMQTGFDLEWSIGCWDSSFSYDCYKSGNYLPPWLAAFRTIWNVLSAIYLVGRFILAPIEPQSDSPTELLISDTVEKSL